MKSLGFLFVLSAIIATAYSITCKSCLHISDQPCTGNTVSCASDEVCTAAYTLVSVLGALTPQYSISCGQKMECNVTGSLTFIYGKVRTGTSCCDTDNCDPPTPQLPAESTQKNGLTCSTCSSDKFDYCYTSDTMTCTGEEMKCGRMARRLTGTLNANDSIRGCATKSFCDILGNHVVSISGLNVDSKMYCSDGAVGLQEGLLFPALAFLLAKLLI